MRPSLQLKLSQQLTMTPQLQQAIALLQCSSQELDAKILEAIESNPLLERTENVETDRQIKSLEALREERKPAATEDESWDRHWGNDPRSGRTPMRRNFDDSRTLEIADPDQNDLDEHLLWQLNLSPLSATDRAIGVALIDAINEDGYLTESLESIANILTNDEVEVEVDEVESVLHRLQRFDPVGVGSRDLAECLGVQLDVMGGAGPVVESAAELVAGHLDLLAAQDRVGLKRALRLDDDALAETIELVRSLDPRPASGFATRPVEYVRPDVIVEKREDEWTVRVPGEAMAPLKVNELYQKLASTTKGEDQAYLREHLNEARWLIRSIATRNETLVKVASAIVKVQSEFFECGPEAMKPLVLREIAEMVELHESTISRVTNSKFMLTPRGVFEFKYFFSSHVGTQGGGECSATAIQAMIRKMIDDESPQKPLSDARIGAILNSRGIDVARRTVAKYREAMNIPASSKRKRLI